MAKYLTQDEIYDLLKEKEILEIKINNMMDDINKCNNVINDIKNVLYSGCNHNKKIDHSSCDDRIRYYCIQCQCDM